jgi:SagB-type dehydrogenase family enzyme
LLTVETPERIPNMPLRPRFLEELAVVGFEDGLLVDGAGPLQVLAGTATQSLVPRLIELTDGSRTLDQVQAELAQFSPDDVAGAISLLVSRGLVEEGSPAQTITPQSAEVLAFLRRYVGTTGANRNGQEAYDRLQRSEVAIPGSNRVSHETEILKSLLEKSCIGRVTLLNRESLSNWWPDASLSPAHALLVFQSFGDDDQEFQLKLDDWCFEHRHTWLRAVIDGDGRYADLGPLFKPERSPCYSCFQKVHGRADRPRTAPPREITSTGVGFWSSMVATEVIYLLSCLGYPITERQFRRYDLEQGRPRLLHFPRIPGCRRCRPSPRDVNSAAPKPSADLIETAVVFEDYVGLQSRPISPLGINEGTAQIDWSRAFESKRLPNCKAIALSPDLPALEYSLFTALHKEAAVPEIPLRLEDLSAILLTTGGLQGAGARPDKVKRWAASGGNLGSVELYVAARSVDGLEPGVYFYQSHEHSLARLERRSKLLEVEEFIRRAVNDTACGTPDALVIFTGAFHRVVRKYSALAYRLINLDAGAALSQLHLVAKSVNVMPRTAAYWADDLIEEQLNLEPFGEQSTAVVALSGRTMERGLEPTRPPGQWQFPVRDPEAAKPARDFCEMEMPEVLKLLYRESRRMECGVASRTIAPASELFDFRPDGSTDISLPSPHARGRICR